MMQENLVAQAIPIDSRTSILDKVFIGSLEMTTLKETTCVAKRACVCVWVEEV